MPHPPRTCKNSRCGQTFTPRRRDQVYCDLVCQKRTNDRIYSRKHSRSRGARERAAARNAEICRRRKAGETVKDLAAEYGLNVQWTYALIRRTDANSEGCGVRPQHSDAGPVASLAE